MKNTKLFFFSIFLFGNILFTNSEQLQKYQYEIVNNHEREFQLLLKQPISKESLNEMKESVRSEFFHAWNGVKQISFIKRINCLQKNLHSIKILLGLNTMNSNLFQILHIIG